MEGDLRPQVRARGSLSTRAQHVSCCRAHGGGLADGAEHGFGTGATASVTQATRDSAAPHPGVWGPAAAIFPAGMGVEGGARRRPVGLSLDVSGLTTWRFPVAQGLLVTHFWGTAKPRATNGTSVLSGGRGLLSRSRLLCKQRISQRPGGGRQPGPGLLAAGRAHEATCSAFTKGSRCGSPSQPPAWLHIVDGLCPGALRSQLK